MQASPITRTDTHRATAQALGTRHMFGFADLAKIYDYLLRLPDSDLSRSDLDAVRPLTAVGAGGDWTETGGAFSLVVLVDWTAP